MGVIRRCVECGKVVEPDEEEDVDLDEDHDAEPVTCDRCADKAEDDE